MTAPSINEDVVRRNAAAIAMSAAELTASMQRFARALETTTPRIAEMAAAIRGLALASRRRSGHRHRGTRDWRQRYAPGRPDLPLGQRTAAKFSHGIVFERCCALFEADRPRPFLRPLVTQAQAANLFAKIRDAILDGTLPVGRIETRGGHGGGTGDDDALD